MKTYRLGQARRFWVALALGGGAALAATLFDPDWINTGTNATQPVGYVGAPSASGYLLPDATSQVQLYTIDYSSADWSGDLHSRVLSGNGTLSVSDSWGNGSAYQITAQNYDTGRMIVTMSGTAGVPFRWANLSSAQKTALDLASASATTSPVLNFIRGDRSNETPSGLQYRARNEESVLGDIIHSTPLHWDDGTNRTVFVGANDGMLHAINADADYANGGGQERFAFIPSQLISKLPLLKVKPYTHRYFVDGQLVARIFPAYTESGGTARTEKSILIGALGGGGRGLFALDIGAVPTSESDAATKVMWEISNATSGYANLGHTYGTPVLTRLPNGDAALIMSNGYNNTGNGHATLYVINPHSGAKIAEYDTGSGTTSSPNGLSSPTVVDTNFDGMAEYVYAGDIDGNLWKFDLSSFSSTPEKLFPTTTATQTSPAQAITMAPGFKVHPLGGRMVTFVTGKIFDTTDAADTSVHYAYGIWDRPTSYADNDTLLTQTLTEASYTGVNPAIRVRTATNNVPDWTAGAGHHMGWKTALPVGGERVVGDGAYVTGSVFLFLATNPTIDPTATPPGENWWMQINALTGGDNGVVRFDLNADTHFTSADQVGSAMPVGRHMGGGVRSQLTAFTTSGFDIYQANYDKNGDPPSSSSSSSSSTTQGVSGGHFDVDTYYGSSTSSTGKASGSVTFTYASSSTSKTVTALTIKANGETVYSYSNASGMSKKPKDLDDFLNGKSSANYTLVKNYGDDHTVQVLAKASGATFNGPVTVTLTTNGSSPGYTKVDLTGGVDAAAAYGDSCVGSACQSKQHFHQYDDKFDVTGVNYLNASSTTMNLSNGVPSLTQNFKVIVSNQYLNPAVKMHIGNASYQYNVDSGYIALKNYTTGSTLDLATLQTYRRDPATVWPGTAVTSAEKLAQPMFIGSFAINMPIDALSAKDWWGNGDVRVGLHPTVTGCVKKAAGANDGNMYQPVIPPANGVDGPGLSGYSGTTPATATGVRHNGALVVQIISDTTPNSALEMSVPGRPEYGWRVKSADYGNYVLTEYTTFWHHPNDKCYGDSGWTKTPGADTGSSTLQSKEPGSTDPKIGSLGAMSEGTTTTTVTNEDGSTTTTTVVVVLNADGTYTTTTTVTTTTVGGDSTSSTSTTSTNTIEIGGAVDSSGAIGGGVTTPLEALGRVNWRELRR